MGKTIPIVRLEGAIAASGVAGAPTLCAAGVEAQLKAAFSVRGAPAVALSINSPGGSPVQSSLIATRIRQWADEKSIPVIAFVEDVAASGGYWIACAADEIILDPASIVGSIGVISAGFGAQDAIARLGVERRVYTAGQSKSQLDPFRPENPEEVEKWREKLDALHQVFIAHVKARRGAKLATDVRLFDGDIFIGAAAVKVGLADGLGNAHGFLKQRFGAKVKLKPIGARKPSLLGRLLGASATNVADALLQGLETRALWARYGL